jgi:hypothetical protein
MTNKGLKFERKEVLEVDYSDLERFIEQEYEHEFSFPADEELGNDVEKLYDGIDGKLDKYDAESVKSFAGSGEGSYITRHLLNDLCKRGRIPAGNYLVNVCW